MIPNDVRLVAVASALSLIFNSTYLPQVIPLLPILTPFLNMVHVMTFAWVTGHRLVESQPSTCRCEVCVSSQEPFPLPEM